MYPISKYKFYTTSNQNIIAVSTYAGKTVRGIAKLHPHDVFNEDFGKILAAAKCEEKVARKRLTRAQKKVAQAKEALAAAEEHLQKMVRYEQDAHNELNYATLNLANIKKG